MTCAPVVLAAMLAAWGPIWPASETTAPETSVPEPETAPAPVPTAPAPPPAPAAPAIIARGPIDLRARPTLVASPRPAQEPRKPLHKQWAFWALAGGFFVAVVTAAIIATRPAPEAYRGNAPPYHVPFP